MRTSGRLHARARITIEDDDSSLRIAVRDDGPGIPDEDLERVFEPFFRLERSRNRGSGGAGLGLAIARNIARWHGGDIHLRNAAHGKGLAAELALPRASRSTPRPGDKRGGRAAKWRWDTRLAARPRGS